jgi:hypothetical protein
MYRKGGREEGKPDGLKKIKNKNEMMGRGGVFLLEEEGWDGVGTGGNGMEGGGVVFCKDGRCAVFCYLLYLGGHSILLCVGGGGLFLGFLV